MLISSKLPRLAVVLNNIGAERLRQLQKWGEQHHPDGTGPGLVVPFLLEGYDASDARDYARGLCDREHEAGNDYWHLILLEEVFEVLAEDDSAKLRAELVQVAAVCCAWIEDIDSREVPS